MWHSLFLTCAFPRAQSLQSRLTLCDSMDYSPPGASVRGTSRQEYWSGLPCPPPGDLPDPGISPVPLTSPASAGRFFTIRPTWEAITGGLWLLVYSIVQFPHWTTFFSFCSQLLNLWGEQWHWFQKPTLAFDWLIVTCWAPASCWAWWWYWRCCTGKTVISLPSGGLHSS